MSALMPLMAYCADCCNFNYFSHNAKIFVSCWEFKIRIVCTILALAIRNFVCRFRLLLSSMKSKQSAGKIHIGSRIREKVNTSGMTVTEFADKINYSRRNIYSIFSKESIDTSLLFKISEVLKYNFFNDFSRLFYNSKDKLDKVNEDLPGFGQNQKVETLQKEVNYLKKIIDLMEKKEKPQR